MRIDNSLFRVLRSRRRAQGFSVVELLVASAIAGIVFGSVAVVMGTHARSFNANMESSGARQNARLAMLMIQRDIRAAGSNVFFDQNPLGPVYADASLVNAATGLEYPADVRRAAPYATEEVIKSPYPLSRTSTHSDGSLVNQVLKIDRMSGPAFEADTTVHRVGGTVTAALSLQTGIPASEQPFPDWSTGTYILVMGESESGNMGVVRKVTGGGYPSYVLSDDGSGFNSQFPIGIVTAGDVVAGARIVMEINRRVEYTLDTTSHTLMFQDINYESAPSDIMSGIADIRLFMNQNGSFVPFDPTAEATILRIEVDAYGEDGDVATVSGLAELRNYDS